MTSPTEALKELWSLLGGNPSTLERVSLSGVDPVLPSSFRVGTAAQAAIAASGLAAAQLHCARGGSTQRVSVDMVDAAMEFLSERYLEVNGGPAPELWDELAGTYRCGDGRWLRIHTNFAHHRKGVLDILGCEGRREALVAAFAGWKADAFETEAANRGAIAAVMRRHAEWDAHPQGQAVAGIPVITLERIGAAPPEPLPPGERPLSGVRVLDLTRIIAGPVAGRTLAAHGADVLLVTSGHLPSIAPLVIDTGRGKLSTDIDLRDKAGKRQLQALLADADIMIQGYRPGAIAELGFSPEQAAQVRSGIVYVSLSAYGHAGPWSKRRGFDSIVQTASGINADEAHATGVDDPRALPCQALDHASGYLMAFGAMMALQRRIREGGSWHVRVALARTARWLRDLGHLENGLDCTGPSRERIDESLEYCDSGFGRLSACTGQAWG